jgi:hypothetical protein
MGHQGVTLVAVQTEGRVHAQIAAGRHADLQAPARQDIELRRILSHADGQLQRQGDDGGPQPDSRSPRGDVRQEDEGRRQATFELVEMVLGDPCCIEAESLRMNDLLGAQPIALGRGHFIEYAREESQALS